MRASYLINFVLLALNQVAFSADEAESMEVDSWSGDAPQRIIPDASNLHQIERNTPSAISVIDSNLLWMLGINDPVEAMRLVQGMRIGTGNNRLPYVQYHGSNGTKSRMGVSVDGFDLLQPFRHHSFWDQIDVSQLKSFTVSRSSGGATFGQGSAVAQINFETRKAKDNNGFEASATAGSRGTKKYSFSGGGAFNENIDLSVSGWSSRNDGFDFDETQKAERIDYTDSRALKVQTTYTKGSHALDFAVSTYRAQKGDSLANFSPEKPKHNDPDDPVDKEKNDVFARYTNSGSDSTLIASLAYQDYNSKQMFSSCNYSRLFSPALRSLSEINPDLSLLVAFNDPYDAASVSDNERVLIDQYNRDVQMIESTGQTYICSRQNQNLAIKRLGGDLSYELLFTEKLRSVFGYKYATEEYTSATYFDGTVSKYTHTAFVQLEYTVDDLTINLGGSTEKGSEFEGLAAALRASVNWHLDTKNTIRLAYSQGYRSPELIESKRYWGYRGPSLGDNPFGSNDVEFFYRGKTDTKLSLEKIESYEVSFLHKTRSLSIDVKLFIDDLKSLVDDNITFYTSNISNDIATSLKGGEFSVSGKWKILEGGIVYSYIDYDAPSKIENMLAATHQGAIYGISHLPHHQKLALAFYGNSKMADSSYGRSDLVYTKCFISSSSKKDLELQLKYSYFTNRKTSIHKTDLLNAISYLDSKHEFYITISFRM